MLRKLILLAISSGLAKKAWDKYHANDSGTAMAGAKPRPSTPFPRANSSESKTDTPARNREPKPDAS